MLPLFSPSSAAVEMIWGLKDLFYFFFSLFLQLNCGVFFFFPAGWLHPEICPLLSRIHLRFQWLLETWLSCMSVLGQMAGDSLPSPAPGRQGCLSVWVVLKRLALEDLRKVTFCLMKDYTSKRSCVRPQIQRPGF